MFSSEGIQVRLQHARVVADTCQTNRRMRLAVLSLDLPFLIQWNKLVLSPSDGITMLARQGVLSRKTAATATESKANPMSSRMAILASVPCKAATSTGM
jgi:hypothetical protein